MFKIIIIGCGYAADFYAANLTRYTDISVVGIYDISKDRMNAFTLTYGYKVYHSIDSLISSVEFDMIINITPPKVHYEISKLFLKNGKSVYSEKPFVTTVKDGVELLEIANNTGAKIISAPAIMLSKPFQKLLDLERNNEIGKSFIIRCNIHEGPVHLMEHHKWISESGAIWPAKNEFETGCLLEHGAYAIDLITALWGGVKSVTSHSDLIYEDKSVTTDCAPDWAQLTLDFENGNRAIVNLSIVEPEDHSFIIIGEKGYIKIDDIWRSDTKVTLRKHLSNKIERPPDFPDTEEIFEFNQNEGRAYEDTHLIDQVSGIHDFAMSIQKNKAPYLCIQRALHSTEILVEASKIIGIRQYSLNTSCQKVKVLLKNKW